LDRVQAAGSVFLGDWTPEALGDYCSGTNHVLPTGGAARAMGGLGVASFQITMSVQAATPGGIAAIGPCAVALARAEGLEAHRRAVALRLAGGTGMSAQAGDVLELLREDLHDYAGYRSARSEAASGTVWLNANEAAYPNLADGGDR